jgi:hypothetical protein
VPFCERLIETSGVEDGHKVLSQWLNPPDFPDHARIVSKAFKLKQLRAKEWRRQVLFMQVQIFTAT